VTRALAAATGMTVPAAHSVVIVWGPLSATGRHQRRSHLRGRRTSARLAARSACMPQPHSAGSLERSQHIQLSGERAQPGVARSGHQSARGCLRWPPRRAILSQQCRRTGPSL